jgi:hypothetical protein
MNYETITLDDCVDMFKKKQQITIIENGQVVGFEKENQGET